MTGAPYKTNNQEEMPMYQVAPKRLAPWPRTTVHVPKTTTQRPLTTTCGDLAGRREVNDRPKGAVLLGISVLDEAYCRGVGDPEGSGWIKPGGERSRPGLD
jgi:hypothetical protein